MNPSLTLRRIADLALNDEIKHLAAQLADELELQHNKQNNAFQVALGNAELGWSNQLDAIVQRLDRHDTRDQQILDMLEALHQEMRERLNRLELLEQARQVNDDANASG